MKWPPYLMHLKVNSPQHVFNIWFPLFIIGLIALIFLLALFLIALPFLLLSLLFTWRWDWWQYVWRGVPAFFGILHALPGLKVDVEDRGKHISIAFY